MLRRTGQGAQKANEGGGAAPLPVARRSLFYPGKILGPPPFWAILDGCERDCCTPARRRRRSVAFLRAGGVLSRSVHIPYTGRLSSWRASARPSARSIS